MTVRIAYEAVLAADLPNGLMAGERLALQGRSVFAFQDWALCSITDYS